MKRLSAIVLVAVMALSLVLLFVFSAMGEKDFRKKYEGFNLDVAPSHLDRENPYTAYKARYANSPLGRSDIAIALDTFDRDTSTGVSIVNDADREGPVLRTEEGSSITWTLDIPSDGLYNIHLVYKGVNSRGVDMERAILIDGEYPFYGARRLTFTRLWADGGPITTDNRGNEIRPRQVEVYDWAEGYCRDDLGYESEPFRFWFEAGTRRFTIKAENEPMLLGAITLKAIKEDPDYQSYVASKPAGAKKIEGTSLTIQGESTYLRSDPSLFAKYDRASAYSEPYSVWKNILNYSGGDAWRASGQWMEWKVEAPESGWYQIGIKARQRFERGYIASRMLFIDGEVPFDAMRAIPFRYSSEWEMVNLGDEEGNPYYFYLERGTHTLRLEATLGRIGQLIGELEDTIFRLNNVYRTILVLTGTNPDPYRDYNLHMVYPEEIEAMDLESKRLYRMVDRLVEYTGQKSGRIAAAQTLAIQLERFVERPERITKTFQAFKDNITSLGTSLLNLTETKLDVDAIVLSGASDPAPRVSRNFFKQVGHGVGSFFSSFFVDHESLGNVYEEDSEDIVEVWLVTGRDQSTVLKTMVDDTFTPDSGIKVNVKLINPNAVLPAVVAGNNPDVVLSIYSSLPVDYALRNAVVDLSQFEGFDEVIKQFHPATVVPFRHAGGVYALPETQNFTVLFYRTDILEEMGLEVPQTWLDLVSMLATLQSANLSVGIPFPSVQIMGAASNLSAFQSMLFQHGARIYNDKGTRTLIDSENGVEAFELFTDFFTSYGLPLDFDFVSRFRSGEMPIGVVDYGTYNTLVVSAPEIRGLWQFAPLPGTEITRPDGSTYINRKVATGGNCSVMIRNEDEATKLRAWEFMKWWVSTPTQVRFGREMESILGASARYPTANRAALRQMAWNAEQLAVLEASIENTVGVPEVPGGYYTPRHLTNAVRKVINDRDDPRETLIDYAREINEELTKKRREFGLDLE